MGSYFRAPFPLFLSKLLPGKKMSSTQLGLQSYVVPKDWLRVSFVFLSNSKLIIKIKAILQINPKLFVNQYYI